MSQTLVSQHFDQPRGSHVICACNYGQLNQVVSLLAEKSNVICRNQRTSLRVCLDAMNYSSRNRHTLSFGALILLMMHSTWPSEPNFHLQCDPLA